MKLVMAAYKISAEERITLNNIKTVITQAMELEGLAVDGIDTASYTVKQDCPILVFGSEFSGVEFNAGFPTWKMPPLSKLITRVENRQTKKDTFARLKEEIFPALKEFYNRKTPTFEEPQLSIETPSGPTVGNKNTDIEISEREVEYLKSLKDLLGKEEGKITIRKGDTVIEIE